MNIVLTNSEIYDYANNLINFQKKEIKLPIKISFYLQKNQTELISLAQNIEQQRINLIQEYGIFNEETKNYDIPPEKISITSKKINELFNLTQEVKIYKVKLKDFGNIEFTSEEMQALLFMIEDEKEEK